MLVLRRRRGQKGERARDKEIERERAKLREYSVRIREGKVRSRRAARQKKRGTDLGDEGDARGTDGRPV